MGEITKSETEIVISEIPSGDAIYDSLTLPTLPDEIDADMNLLRRHAQIQIALIIIGRQLGFRTWVAQNDRAIEYDNQKIVEMPGIILSLNDERLLSSYVEAARAALFIDCIWFRNSRFMPAVLEIEHTTGVTSGLSRMKNFQDVLPPFPTRWVIVAPDEDREKVMQEANKEQFRSLNTQYFPYSAVEELFSLCQRRHITGVLDEFLDSFMERCLN